MVKLDISMIIFDEVFHVKFWFITLRLELIKVY
jgi:hypothetical protein